MIPREMAVAFMRRVAFACAREDRAGVDAAKAWILAEFDAAGDPAERDRARGLFVRMLDASADLEWARSTGDAAGATEAAGRLAAALRDERHVRAASRVTATDRVLVQQGTYEALHAARATRGRS